MKYFELLEGEKIIEDIKPLIGLRKYFAFINYALITFAIALLIFPFLLIDVTISHSPFQRGSFIPLWIYTSIFFLYILLLMLGRWVAVRRYDHRHYWITDKRIISKSGIIGYKVKSIPLERISDVTISRSFLERYFGFGSILIQSLAGQLSYGRMGAECHLAAIPDPEKIQKKIFELIKEKRKKEKLTM
jgi:uncharacterized membrane protein YdbT with pleckstrin-like domain